VRGIAAGDPSTSTAVGAYVDRTQCSMRTARIDRQSCMRSSHAPRTRNPEPRVRENRKTESRKTDSEFSGTVCRKTPSAAARSGTTAGPLGLPRERSDRTASRGHTAAGANFRHIVLSGAIILDTAILAAFPLRSLGPPAVTRGAAARSETMAGPLGLPRKRSDGLARPYCRRGEF
jgi:hypothetical protein